MTANRDLLVNYCEFPEPEPVALGDGRYVNAYGYGKVDITMILGKKAKDQQKTNSNKGTVRSKVGYKSFQCTCSGI